MRAPVARTGLGVFAVRDVQRASPYAPRDDGLDGCRYELRRNWTLLYSLLAVVGQLLLQFLDLTLDVSSLLVGVVDQLTRLLEGTGVST